MYTLWCTFNMYQCIFMYILLSIYYNQFNILIQLRMIINMHLFYFCCSWVTYLWRCLLLNQNAPNFSAILGVYFRICVIDSLFDYQLLLLNGASFCRRFQPNPFTFLTSNLLIGKLEHQQTNLIVLYTVKVDDDLRAFLWREVFALYA